MGNNSRILEPATFANGMRRPHCQEWKSQPSSLECCSWLLNSLESAKGKLEAFGPTGLERAGAPFLAVRIRACLALVLLC